MAVPAPTVRTIGRDDPRLPQTLRGKLSARQTQLMTQLASGSAEDWPDYKHRAGVIRGLQEAMDICTEIEREQER